MLLDRVWPTKEEFSLMIASLSSIFPEVSVIQQSSLSPSRLQASASHAAAGSASLATGSEPWILIADTRTHETSNLFQVEFTVDEPTAYGLTAGVAAMGGGFIGETAVHVELRRASGEVLHRIALEDDEDCLDPSCLDLGSLALDEGGTLAAGSYVLEAALVGSAEALVTAQFQAASSHEGSFEVDLRLGPQVPLPGFVSLAVALGVLASGFRCGARGGLPPPDLLGRRLSNASPRRGGATGDGRSRVGH